MDANDKERYDKIINTIESYNYHIERSVENQLRINKQFIDEFNNN